MVIICPVKVKEAYKMDENFSDLEKSREEAEILSSKTEGKVLMALKSVFNKN